MRDAATERWHCVPRDEDIILGRIVPAGPDRALVAEFGTIERLPGGRLPGRRGELTGVPEDVYLFDLWFDDSGQVGIAVVDFDARDIVRHPLVARIVRAYESPGGAQGTGDAAS